MTIALTGGLVTAAWRNFIRNLRRYRVLLVALVLIVMALTAVLGTILGLQGAVREKASRYFAGDLVVLGYDGSGSSLIAHPEEVVAAVERLEAGEPSSCRNRVPATGPGCPVVARRLPVRREVRRPRRAAEQAGTEPPKRPASTAIPPTPKRTDRIRHPRRSPAPPRRWILSPSPGAVPTTTSSRSSSSSRDTTRGSGASSASSGSWSGRSSPSLTLLQGGVPERGDEGAVLISTATARELGIAVGDNLLVSIRSDRGRSNTAEFIVAGIYIESSFFGYTTYLHRHALNRLREAPEGTVNEIGVYLRDAADEASAAAALTAALGEEGLPTFGVMTDRDAYSAEASRRRSTREYGVVSLGAQLSEISDLLGAITIIAGAIMVLFLGIVTVGVSNTWTMVVWERTREIGTLRALGMQRTGTAALFLLEALFLGAGGVTLGFGLGIGLLAGVERWVAFEPNAFTTLFLTQSRLAWDVPGWGAAAIAGLAIGASLFGALRAAVRAGRVNPVEALRHEK
jgi:ABC-type lipoprotein release transport system permease subunit